jgi:hypothetical protein
MASVADRNYHLSSDRALDFSVHTGEPMLLLILTVVLIVALIGSIPKWPHSRSWGYFPSGGVGLILVILLVLYLLGRL